MKRIFLVLPVLAGLVAAAVYFRPALQDPKTTVADSIAPDGSRYYGPLVDDKRQGMGKVEWDNGDRYEGSFENGLFSGKGRLVRANGDLYEGEFQQGYPSGHGKATYSNGDEYEGQFELGMMQGKGRYQQKSGEVYKGDFLKDEFTGQGTYILADKERRFEGRFLTWEAHGPGTYTDSEGNRFSGNFVKGELQGTGQYIGKDGTRYEGNFKSWIYHGYGVLKHANGDVYTGQFVDGDYSGQGTLKYAVARADGRTEDTGIWEYGALKGENRSELIDANNEKALYNQHGLLSKAFADVAPSDPKHIELYLIAVAGDGSQEVFRREAEFVRDQFDRDFGSKGRSLVLLNSRSSVDRAPLATVTSIREAINAVAARMDKQNDILFLYLTSHGSRKFEFSLQQERMSFGDLKATALAEALKQSGIRHKVVVISACYSGGFIDPLKDEQTMVITAARHDRTSFGCDDENEFTYFGRAYFKEALPRSGSFAEAFAKASALIKEWEDADQKKNGKDTQWKHSLPQMYNPKPIEEHLKRWQASLPARAAPPPGP